MILKKYKTEIYIIINLNYEREIDVKSEDVIFLLNNTR